MAFCERCGSERPIIFARFDSRAGYVVWSERRWIEGYFCSDCLHAEYKVHTSYCLKRGWWSVVGIVETPVMIIRNVVRHLVAQRQLRSGRSVGVGLEKQIDAAMIPGKPAHAKCGNCESVITSGSVRCRNCGAWFSEERMKELSIIQDYPGFWG